MTPGRDQIVLQASSALKEALGDYAQEHNESMAETIRRAVAALIGYDLANDPKTVRTTKYDSPEAQKKAQLERAALVRWARATGQRLLADGQIEAATVIARATADKDYEALDELKTAFDAMKEATASE